MDTDSSMPAGEISGEPTYADLVEMVSGLRADAMKRASELHTWKETATALRAANRDLKTVVNERRDLHRFDRDRLIAEVERMRPVVDAACRHIDAPDGMLRLEVEAYRATSEQETTDAECPSCGAQVDEPACANPKCVGRKF